MVLQPWQQVHANIEGCCLESMAQHGFAGEATSGQHTMPRPAHVHHLNHAASPHAYLGRGAEAERLGDGQQVQAVHVEYVLQLVTVVREDISPA